MKKNIFITFTIYFLLFGICQAQWQPDVRLTNDPAASNTSVNNAWCIASSGDIVHAVWYDNRDGNEEIYYKNSTNGGVSWGADTRLTNDSAVSKYPSVAVSGSFVHVVWTDRRDGIFNYEIYYKRSANGGVSWGADLRLTNSTYNSFNPSVTASGSVVHVVWEDQIVGGNTEIYCKSATYGSLIWVWGDSIRLTYNTSESQLPSVAVSGSVVHVVWEDDRGGNREIYYKRSINGGINWEADTRLTDNSAASVFPSVSVSGQGVYVLWVDERDGNLEIYYKRSFDGGTSWGTDTRLTNNTAQSLSPSATVSGLVVHVVWEDGIDGNYEIYYKRSTDGGINWEANLRLTNNTAASVFPSVSVSGQVVHVVWQDERDGNFEIYYKRNPTGNTASIFPWRIRRNNLLKSIIDNEHTSDTIFIGFNALLPFTVLDVNLEIDTVLHTNDSDLEFYLLHNGITDTVIYQVGGSGDNFIGTLLNDSAANPISSGSAPFTGSFMPHKQLSQFNNGDVNGTWILKIFDRATGNTGTLQAWSLIFIILNNPIGIQTIGNEIPKGFSLSQNYPNPFNPTTKIRFSLPHPSEGGAMKVLLKVYDLLGREVATLVNEQLNAGTYEVDWSATGVADKFSSGVYFYKFTTDEFSETRKMVLMK